MKVFSRSPEKGSALLISLFCISLLMYMAAAFLSMSVNNYKMAKINSEFTKAMWIAEAGVAKIIYNLRYSPVSNEQAIVEENFGGGSYKVGTPPIKELGIHEILACSIGRIRKSKDSVFLKAKADVITDYLVFFPEGESSSKFTWNDSNLLGGPIHANGDFNAHYGGSCGSGIFMKSMDIRGPVISLVGTIPTAGISGSGAKLIIGEGHPTIETMKQCICQSNSPLISEFANYFILGEGGSGDLVSFYNPDNIYATGNTPGGLLINGNHGGYIIGGPARYIKKSDYWKPIEDWRSEIRRLYKDYIDEEWHITEENPGKGKWDYLLNDVLTIKTVICQGSGANQTTFTFLNPKGDLIPKHIYFVNDDPPDPGGGGYVGAYMQQTKDQIFYYPDGTAVTQPKYDLAFSGGFSVSGSQITLDTTNEVSYTFTCPNLDNSGTIEANEDWYSGAREYPFSNFISCYTPVDWENFKVYLGTTLKNHGNDWKFAWEVDSNNRKRHIKWISGSFPFPPGREMKFVFKRKPPLSGTIVLTDRIVKVCKIDLGKDLSPFPEDGIVFSDVPLYIYGNNKTKEITFVSLEDIYVGPINADYPEDSDKVFSVGAISPRLIWIYRRDPDNPAQELSDITLNKVALYAQHIENLGGSSNTTNLVGCKAYLDYYMHDHPAGTNKPVSYSSSLGKGIYLYHGPMTLSGTEYNDIGEQLMFNYKFWGLYRATSGKRYKYADSFRTNPPPHFPGTLDILAWGSLRFNRALDFLTTLEEYAKKRKAIPQKMYHDLLKDLLR